MNCELFDKNNIIKTFDERNNYFIKGAVHEKDFCTLTLKWERIMFTCCLAAIAGIG